MSGCKKFNSKDIIEKYEKNLNSINHYILTGEMNIVSNEELYKYDVKVNYLKDNYYKVILNNKETNYEQIIIKNDDGVFVVTPSINKSFKYQSEWPYNSSQSYILKSLLNDLKSDPNVSFKEENEEYILDSTVNYPNNTSLTYQKIVFDKNIMPKMIDVFNKDGNSNINFKVYKIDLETKLTKKDFDVNNLNYEENEEVSVTEETVYPMYIPMGTKFRSEETINTNESKRVILTFDGDKPFTLIEEINKQPSKMEVTSTNAELVFYETVLGNLSDSTLNWHMNGKDYYIISNDLTHEELLKVAASTSVLAINK